MSTETFSDNPYSVLEASLGRLTDDVLLDRFLGRFSYDFSGFFNFHVSVFYGVQPDCYCAVISFESNSVKVDLFRRIPANIIAGCMLDSAQAAFREPSIIRFCTLEIVQYLMSIHSSIEFLGPREGGGVEGDVETKKGNTNPED